MKIGEAFYQRIAKPIGMEDFQPSDGFYFGGPLSIHPAYHFEITARDMARFGLLYLRHGRWNGKQIVPEAWVEKSSHASEMVQTDGVDRGGYEYLWWADSGGVHFPEVSLPGIYSARGNGAHFIFIIPTGTWSSCIARTTMLRSRMPKPLRKLRIEGCRSTRSEHNSVIW